MKRLKAALRLFLKCIVGFILTLLLFGLLMFILSRITVNADDKDTAADVVVFLRSNGVHTDIVVPIRHPIKDWGQEISPESDTGTEQYTYVGFGWGDRDFYLNTPQWSDLKLKTALAAVFYVGKSAMHTTFYRSIAADDRCIRLSLSGKEYRALTAFIESGFHKPDGKVIPISDAAYNRHDSFYEGSGKYSLVYTCNSWTNEALKASGQRAALWTLTDTGILYHYQ